MQSAGKWLSLDRKLHDSAKDRRGGKICQARFCREVAKGIDLCPQLWSEKLQSVGAAQFLSLWVDVVLISQGGVIKCDGRCKAFICMGKIEG